MPLRRKYNERGISLLEVLIGMIILACGILGMAPMVVLSMEGNNISRDVTIASNLAKEKMEYFEGLSPLPTFPYEEKEDGLSGNYTRSVRMWDSTVDTLVPPDLCQLDITIVWTDQAGTNRAMNYSTFILKKD